MKPNDRSVVLLLLATFITAAARYADYSCVVLPTLPFNYAAIAFPTDVVNNLANMDNTPVDNPITDAGATLGRVLFYDTDLSIDGSMSCGSCHVQRLAFADTARFSRKVNGGVTGRNTPGLVHARFQRDGHFFWDNRAATLEEQVLMPVVSDEMGMTLDSALARIAAKPFYAPLFQNAFGSSAITVDGMRKAMAQFIRSMNTFGSHYRQGVELTNGNPEVTPFVNFTAQENLGKDLFMDVERGNCQACHTRNVMVQQGAQNIGLDLIYADNGVGALTNNPNSGQNGKFSVPSLINVELTAPYMHDGRFNTLEEVVAFYSDSIKPHPNLSGFLRAILPGTIDPNNNQCLTCPPRIIHYSPAEQQALVAFLRTLTDTTLLGDPRWSDPFCYVSLSAKVILEGPYVQGTGLMNDGLRTAGLVPLVEPYSEMGHAQAGGGGGETTSPQVLARTGPNAIVDWVRLELRGADNSANVVATRQALLQRDGDIVAEDGTSPVRFGVAAGNYHVAVRHRNHLGAMTAAPVTLLGVPAILDLTAVSGLYGSNAMKQIGARRALWTGNTTGDGQVKYTGASNDRDPILTAVGGTVPTNTANGYTPVDLNMDGVVKYTGTANDRDRILGAIGGTVPTATRTEQLP